MFVFLLLLCLFAQASAQVVPRACLSSGCADHVAQQMTWDQAADALKLSYSQTMCFPDVEMVPQADDDLVWSLQANQWHVKNRVGQASLLQGNLSFVADQQILRSDQAWLWRSADGGLDRICLPKHASWTHQAWHMVIHDLVYQADSDEIRACNNAFVLYGRDNQPLYGYASEATAISKNTLILKSVHATTCPMTQRTWSLSADQLDWNVKEKQAVVKNARLYFYDIPFFRVSHMSFSLGDKEQYGWQSPKVSSYYDDPIMISFPYRFRSTGIQTAGPWLGSGVNAGGFYFLQKDMQKMKYRSMIRSGLYREGPHFRYGGIIQGQRKDTLGSDLTQFQFLHMRDGWFGQYFAPSFIPRIRPNQDLPSYIDYQRQDKDFRSIFSLIYYQKFSGEKVLQDEIGIPHLHVLPRIKIIADHKAFEINALAEHLVSELEKDHYPDVTRGLGYLGVKLKKSQNYWLKLGAWMKDQLVDEYAAWAPYKRQHVFITPNFELNAKHYLKDRMGVRFSYAYTRYVDQSEDPVFQRYWRWYGDQLSYDRLASVDRVYDRNRIWLEFFEQGLYLPTSSFSATHIFDMRDPRVSLTQTGDEDPLIRYPNEVTVFRFNDRTYNFSSNGVWVWPIRSFQYYDLHWQYNSLSLQWARKPDYVVFQNQQVQVPIVRVTGGEVDLYKSSLSRSYLGVDYYSGLDRYLKYRLGWVMDRCCWQGKASVHLTRWMSKDESVNRIYTGWQPSANISFSIKGLSTVKRRV